MELQFQVHIGRRIFTVILNMLERVVHNRRPCKVELVKYTFIQIG